MKRYIMVLFVITLMGSMGLGGCGSSQEASTPPSTPPAEDIVVEEVYEKELREEPVEAGNYHDSTKEKDTLCQAHIDAIRYLELYDAELRKTVPDYDKYIESAEYQAFVNSFWENFWEVHSCEICESYR